MGYFISEEHPMKAKKHLGFTPLRKMISSQFRNWQDVRRQGSIDHSGHDVAMSALACMYFQEPSLLQFQREMEKSSQQNNLRTLFGVQSIPSSNAMKEVLDNQDSQGFQPIFKGIIHRLQRGNQLSQFNLFPGLTVCTIDATQYHISESIHCNCCLTRHKDNDDKPTQYYHTALQAALMHPDIKQVASVVGGVTSELGGGKFANGAVSAAFAHLFNNEGKAALAKLRGIKDFASLEQSVKDRWGKIEYTFGENIRGSSSFKGAIVIRMGSGL